MAQEYASGGQLPDDVDRTLKRDGGSTHDDSSTRLERFGVGVSASILLGAVVGVAATAALGGSAFPFIVALGLGFILSPVLGILVLQWSD